MKEDESNYHLDLLKHIERLTEEMNKRMTPHSRFVAKRYPLTFAILALFGVVAVSEGVNGLLEEVSFFHNSPLTLLLVGLLVLIILGSVYKKLNE